MTRRSIHSSLVLALVLPFALTACGGSAGTAESTPSPAPIADASSDASSDASVTLADGVFTAEQADRGKTVFDDTCSECHSLNELHGTDFMFAWEGSSVGRLYRMISTTMPDDDPGSLPGDSYLSVVTYILELNDFPAGSTALVADMDLLNGLRIER